MGEVWQMYIMFEVSLKLVDVLIVFFELFELESVGVVPVHHLESQSCLFVCDILAHFLHHRPELDEVHAALVLLAEIVEHFLQTQLVALDHLVQFYEDLGHALPCGLGCPHLLLHRLLKTVYFEHFDDLFD